jgi:enoyl-CoA hydratase/carnithine racemase
MERMTTAELKVPTVLNGATIRDLRDSLERAYSDEGVRVIVLRGAAEAFCRGMDLGAAGGPSKPERDVPEFASCLERIRLGPKPVVAAVGGAATAGGVGLAAAADLVIATSGATFGLTELMFGLVPAVILPYLAERMGLARARLWGLAAHNWSAAEAQAAGLVDVVAPGEDLDRLLRAWTRRLGRARTAAVGIWKRYTAESRAMSSRAGSTVTLDRLRDPHVLEGIRRFAEKGEAWIPNA